jgi:hypothetical protein
LEVVEVFLAADHRGGGRGCAGRRGGSRRATEGQREVEDEGRKRPVVMMQGRGRWDGAFPYWVIFEYTVRVRETKIKRNAGD